jgi:hypothetical protein
MADSKVFRVYFATDNAAFGKNESEAAPEIARILREIAMRVEDGNFGFPSETIRDYNGNDVGRYALKTLAQWNG